MDVDVSIHWVQLLPICVRGAPAAGLGSMIGAANGDQGEAPRGAAAAGRRDK
jgi:hypothetical protein